MSARNRREGRRPSSVLSAGTDQVEWLGSDRKGATVYGKRRVAGGSAADIARAAAELVAELGLRPGACVLALGQGLLDQRALAFPEMPRKDLRDVAKRKTANLLGADLRETLFSAVPMSAGHPVGAEVKERQWLLLAQRRSVTSELRQQLRRRRFHVTRMVSARLATLCKAQSLRGDTQAACAVVSIWPSSASVSLICGEELVNQSVIQGNFDSEPALAATLIQELRSFEAFWRRASRGSALDQIVVMGLDAENAQQLEPAIRATIRGAQVITLPAADDERPCAGRVEALDACRYEGPFQADLTLPIAPRASSIAAVSLAAALLAGSVGAIGWRQMERSRAQLDTETEGLLARSSDLLELVQGNERIQAELAGLEAALDRANTLGQIGMPLRAMLHHALAAFDRRATLMHLSAIGERLEAEGVTDPNPMSSMLALEDLRGRLEASPFYEHVTLQPPNDVPEPDGGDRKERRAWMTFAVEGLLERERARMTQGLEEGTQ